MLLIRGCNKRGRRESSLLLNTCKKKIVCDESSIQYRVIVTETPLVLNHFENLGKSASRCHRAAHQWRVVKNGLLPQNNREAENYLNKRVQKKTFQRRRPISPFGWNVSARLIIAPRLARSAEPRFATLIASRTMADVPQWTTKNKSVG